MANVVAEGLTKQYGPKTVVDSIDLNVKQGIIYGFLGQNGAGKSTTIRMLCGMLPPTSGHVEIAGIDVRRDPIEVKRRVGYMPEEVQLYERLTAHETLNFTGRMYGLSRAETERRSRDLLDLLRIEEDDRNRLLVDFSMGMRKKVSLACALIHSPQVLFLDEPFNGIDAVSCRIIRGALLQAASRGMTIFFSSHVLEVVEKLCDELAILHAGRVAAAGTLDDVRRRRGFDPGTDLEDVFVEIVGGDSAPEGLAWMR